MTTHSTLISDYVGVGTLAARPTTPNITGTAQALYYATDTTTEYAWNGSAWVAIGGTGGSGTIVAGTGLGGGTIVGSGTITLGTIAAHDLLGNPGTAAAIPVGVAVGTGLTLTADGTLNATGTVTPVLTVTDGSHTISNVGTILVNGGTVSGVSPSSTITVSGTGGSATTIIAGAGLAGGTISTSGTISLGTIAAGDLLGNYGTVAAVPVGVAVGSGLTLSVGGTLSATGSGGGAFPISGNGSSTQNVAVMNATGTNIGMLIEPTGNGAIIAGPPPDATSTGGNARGQYAVDMQIVRTDPTHVASGNHSVVIGGGDNQATSDYDIAGGGGSKASGGHSVALGNNVTVSGQNSFAGGSNVTVSSQNSAAFGIYCNVSQDHSFAAGWGVQVTTGGGYSFGFGDEVSVTSDHSGGFGQNHQITGSSYNYAFGNHAHLSGTGVFAISGPNGNVIDYGNIGAFIYGNPQGGNTGRTQVEHYTFAAFTSGATAVRLTVDGNAAGNTNLANVRNGVSPNAMYCGTIYLAIFDYTANVGWSYRTDIMYGLASSTFFVAGGTFTSVATYGSPPALGAAPTVTADTTYDGLNISFAPPSGNTDNIVASAVVTAVRAGS